MILSICPTYLLQPLSSKKMNKLVSTKERVQMCNSRDSVPGKTFLLYCMLTQTNWVEFFSPILQKNCNFTASGSQSTTNLLHKWQTRLKLKNVTQLILRTLSRMQSKLVSRNFVHPSQTRKLSKKVVVYF